MKLKLLTINYLFGFALLAGMSLPLTTSAADNDTSILVLGDSLSAAYGMESGQGWVTLLEQRLAQCAQDRAGYRYPVINASVSGDTTRGARARLADILARHTPAITIVELGGNDGLRGIAPAEMQRNLGAIIEQLQAVGSDVILVPMQIPPNYGPVFTEKFAAVYTDLAKQYDIALSRFILEGIALDENLMQDDGIHPTAAAQPMMLEHIWSSLQPLLEQQIQQAAKK
ncbi:MAG: arylesterase [Pseudomonadales bacterium]